MKQVIAQIWTESESGWGQRPDGCSIHLNDDLRTSFIDAFNERMDEINKGSVPSSYSFPDGKPYICDVNDDQYQKLVADRESGGYGTWFSVNSNKPPKHITETTYDNELKSRTDNKKPKRRTLGKMG